MFTWLSRSVLILLLLMVFSGTTWAAFNWAEVNKSVTGFSQGIADAGKIGRTPSEDALKTGSSDGKGFYLGIYEEVVVEPHKDIQEQLKRRFGVGIDLESVPSDKSGRYLFSEYFEARESLFPSVLPLQPKLQDSLQSLCIAWKGVEIDDQQRQWRLIKKRLREQEAEEEVLDRVDEVARVRDADLRASLPTVETLTDQQALLNCVEVLQEEVGFESRLQSLLHPSRSQLEALQTFVNGDLGDTTDGMPRYDLLFDIAVIDHIFFGTSVASGLAGRGGQLQDEVGEAAHELFDTTVPSSFPSPTPGGPGSGRGAGSSGGTHGGGSGGGFGSESGDFSGPFCADDPGLDLDFSPIDNPESLSRPSVTADSSRTSSGGSRSSSSISGAAGSSSSGTTASSPAIAAAADGLGINLGTFCEGAAATVFEEDLLRVLFCLSVNFEKVGKTWEVVREDCIACHLYEMNRVFEEELFVHSVRPHKNTGTIMESAICEDGYGDDLGFFAFVEWVPVRFYPDVCYPEGGVSNADQGLVTGYPEIVTMIGAGPGALVNCTADFKDPKAQERCRDVLGAEEVSYEEFRDSYQAGLQREISVEDVNDQDDLYARIVGVQGVAERELHKFLYRLGKAKPRYEEDTVLKKDLKERKDLLLRLMDQIRRDPELEVIEGVRDEKMEQILCLKGYFFGEEQAGGSNAFNCNYVQDFYRDAGKNPDTVRHWEDEVFAERARIKAMLQISTDMELDFSREHSCSVFSQARLFDQFENWYDERFDNGPYLQTDFRRTQTPAEQLTEQITANTDLEDLGSLFSTIATEVESIEKSKKRKADKRSFVGDESKALFFARALTEEVRTFKTLMSGFMHQWSEMIDKKHFVSKSGEKMNVLESFLQKRR